MDTNVLVESGWPKPSVALSNIFILAKRFGLPVFLPELVAREAEAHWMRDVTSQARGLENALRDYHRLTRAIEGRARLEYDAVEVIREKYRQAALAAAQEFGLELIPTTTRPLSELFDLAIWYVLPFERSERKSGGGKGFQDAVILSSVLEHLIAHQELTGVFITNDLGFSNVSIPDFMPRCATREQLVIRSIADVRKALYEKYWEEDVQKPWAEEAESARGVAEQTLPALKDFVQANLSPEMLRRNTARVIEVLAVSELEIQYVQTPVPPPGAPDRSVVAAVAVIANCRVIAEQDFPGLSRLALLAGQSLLAGPPRPTRSEREDAWLGGIEVAAEVRSRKYTNMRPQSLVSIEELGTGKWFR